MFNEASFLIYYQIKKTIQEKAQLTAIAFDNEMYRTREKEDILSLKTNINNKTNGETFFLKFTNWPSGLIKY